MLHKADLNEISDGKIYSRRDLARLGCEDCKGCSSCCRGMGSTVALDPYDAARLAEVLQLTFQQILQGKLIDLSVNDGVFTPYLRMNEESNSCPFLNEAGRCQIHAVRPGVCRLFPLGRIYTREGIRYILQVDECKKTNRSKIRIEDWLGEKQPQAYEDFANSWYSFIEAFREKIFSSSDRELMSEWNTVFLHIFYLKPFQNSPINNFDGFLLEMQERYQLAQKVLELSAR